MKNCTYVHKDLHFARGTRLQEHTDLYSVHTVADSPIDILANHNSCALVLVVPLADRDTECSAAATFDALNSVPPTSSD